MVDKSDGKPGDTGAAGKKPKPLLDLKATEVQNTPPSSGAKPADASSLKGAPTSKEPSENTQSPDAKTSADKKADATVSGDKTTVAKSSSVPVSGSTSSTKPSDAKLAASASASSYGATSGSASGAGSKVQSATAAPVAGAPSTGSDAGGKPGATSGATGTPSAGSGSGSSQSTGGASGGAPPSPTGGKSGGSGGGFFSTMTHLVAGIIGGAIALFAAEPLENEFGIGLMPKPQVPAAIEQRLAALEARPASNQLDVASQKAVAQLTEQVAAAENKFRQLDELREQVAGLSSDVKKAQAPETVAGTSGEGGAGDGDNAPLRQRLAKLESQLATISSATGPSDQASGIAPLAQFSAKFADLEGSLNSQIGSLRSSLVAEMDTRIGKASSSSAQAVAGAERLDRELADVKTDTARLEQRAAVLKTVTDKLAASMRAVSDEAAEIKVELDGLKGTVTKELEKVARPADVQQAIEPVSKKLASLESELGAVVATETARKKNAERIVLSLELSNLKRVLDRGAPYAAELADVKKIAGDAIDFSSLDAHKNEGVLSSQELTQRFRSVAYKMISAEEEPSEDASRMDRLFAAAKSIVKVRRTDIPAEEKTAEAAVARIEERLKAGDLPGALVLAEKLPEKSKSSAGTWMSQLAARAGVDQAIAKIEDQLKSSLGSGLDTGPAGTNTKG